MKNLNNEKGGALIYVLMIVIVLGIFTPVILSAISQNESVEKRNELESKVIHLTVSGMEAFINYSSEPLEQKNYLENGYNENIEIQLSEGETVVYRHFVVPEETSDSQVLAVTPIPFGDIDEDIYKVVITSSVRNSEKTLTRTLDLTATTTERTDPPYVNQLVAGQTVVTGRAVLNSTVKVTRGSQIYTGVANLTSSVAGQGGYSISVGSELVAGESISLTAKSDSKLESFAVGTTVYSTSSPPDHGMVEKKVTDSEGNVTIVSKQFEPVDDTTGVLTIYNNPDVANTTYEGSTLIDLEGDEGIVIQPDVTLQTTHNGQGILKLTSSGGDIDIRNTNIINSGNSNSNTIEDINIVAAGNVYLDGAILTAQRSISITAGGSIYANDATIEITKNGDTTTLNLNPTTSGDLQVHGLSLIGEMGTSNATNICGTLSSGSIDTTSNFGSCN